MSDEIKAAAEWLNLPEHDIGFEPHKSEDCGAFGSVHDPTCERCAVEIALAAYASHYMQERMKAGLVDAFRSAKAEGL